MDLLAQMTTLVRVVEAGSLSAAARQLDLSPAAVSRQIRGLEEQLGVSLVVRTTRKLKVTDAGRRYCERAASILRQVEDAHAALREGRDVRGKLAVSVPVTFGLARVCPRMPELLRKFPGLQLDLRLEDRTVDLVAEGLDLAIRIGEAAPNSTSLVARKLGAYERFAVAAPSYLERRGWPEQPAALPARDALVHAPEGEAARWTFQRDGREVSIEPRGSVRTNVVFALREAALSGLGVALLPEWLVADDLAAGSLRILWPSWSARPVDVVALHRSELKRAPRVRAFLEHLQRRGEPR